MELPMELKSAIEEKLVSADIKQLQEDAENISMRYRNESGKGTRLLTENSEAVSYAAVRMPATYTAIYSALQYTLDLYNEEINTVLDVGAGTGAGSWAVANLLDLEKITCLEREDAMMNLGKSLMVKSDEECLRNAEWKKVDLLEGEILDTADLVICSYVLNEMNEYNRSLVLEKLWKVTKKLLVIIEPGTPIGFNEIKTFRKEFNKKDGKIIAPCPNIQHCPMPEDDWCHATCRVSRSKIHKLLKNGDVPYEDEKYSYISICKENSVVKNFARVLRHPKIESGRIAIKVCTSEGIRDWIITKKDKESFKRARKVKCGDAWIVEEFNS